MYIYETFFTGGWVGKAMIASRCKGGDHLENLCRDERILLKWSVRS
jgi:hypothetical protein